MTAPSTALSTTAPFTAPSRTALSVNVNKIAWLRNARGGQRPDVVDCARTALQSGADGITVHPRADERHIRAADVYALKELVAQHPGAEFNIEGNPVAAARASYPGFDCFIERVRPQQCTLVPDDDDQLTSDHGWDLTDDATLHAVSTLVARYHSWGTRVSLFMDPIAEQISRAKRTGTDRIELYTGPYADLAEDHGLDDPRTAVAWRTYRDAARHATRLGLAVNAGHDLNLVNLAQFLAIGDIAEVSIGHALIADALEFGLADAVQRYAAICRASSKQQHPSCASLPAS